MHVPSVLLLVVSPVPGKQNGVNQSFPSHGHQVFIKMFKSINPTRLTIQCHIGNQRKGLKKKKRVLVDIHAHTQQYLKCFPQ